MVYEITIYHLNKWYEHTLTMFGSIIASNNIQHQKERALRTYIQMEHLLNAINERVNDQINSTNETDLHHMKTHIHNIMKHMQKEFNIDEDKINKIKEIMKEITSNMTSIKNYNKKNSNNNNSNNNNSNKSNNLNKSNNNSNKSNNNNSNNDNNEEVEVDDDLMIDEENRNQNGGKKNKTKKNKTTKRKNNKK